MVSPGRKSLPATQKTEPLLLANIVAGVVSALLIVSFACSILVRRSAVPDLQIFFVSQPTASITVGTNGDAPRLEKIS